MTAFTFRLVAILLLCLAASNAVAQENSPDQFEPLRRLEFPQMVPSGHVEARRAEHLIADGQIDAGFEQYEKGYDKAAKFLPPMKFVPMKIGESTINVPSIPDYADPKAEIAAQATLSALREFRPDIAIRFWNKLKNDNHIYNEWIYGALCFVPKSNLNPAQRQFIDHVKDDPLLDQFPPLRSAFLRPLTYEVGNKLELIRLEHETRREKRLQYQVGIIVVVLALGVLLTVIRVPAWPRRPRTVLDIDHRYVVPRARRFPSFGILLMLCAFPSFYPFYLLTFHADLDAFDLFSSAFFLFLPMFMLFKGWHEFSDRLTTRGREHGWTPLGWVLAGGGRRFKAPPSPSTAWMVAITCDELGVATRTRFGFATEPFEKDEPRLQPAGDWNPFEGLGYAVWLSELCVQRAIELPDTFDRFVIEATRETSAGCRELVTRYLANVPPDRSRAIIDGFPATYRGFLLRDFSQEVDWDLLAELEALELDFRMVTSLNWRWQEWRALYDLDQMGPIAHDIVWRATGDSRSRLFRRDIDGALICNDSEPFDPPTGDVKVEVPHPLTISERDRELWAQHFADYEIQSDVPQFDRKLYRDVDRIPFHDLSHAQERGVTFASHNELVFGNYDVYIDQDSLYGREIFEKELKVEPTSTGFFGLDFHFVLQSEAVRYLRNDDVRTLMFDAIANTESLRTRLWS